MSFDYYKRRIYFMQQLFFVFTRHYRVGYIMLEVTDILFAGFPPRLLPHTDRDVNVHLFLAAKEPFVNPIVMVLIILARFIVLELGVGKPIRQNMASCIVDGLLKPLLRFDGCRKNRI